LYDAPIVLRGKEHLAVVVQDGVVTHQLVVPYLEVGVCKVAFTASFHAVGLVTIHCEAHHKFQLPLANNTIVILLQSSDAYIAYTADVVVVADDSATKPDLIVDRVGTDDALHHCLVITFYKRTQRE